MSYYLCNDPFSTACMNTAFLSHCDDYALAWSVWCMGGEL